jgi:hypothetical protein
VVPGYRVPVLVQEMLLIQLVYSASTTGVRLGRRILDFVIRATMAPRVGGGRGRSRVVSAAVGLVVYLEKGMLLFFATLTASDTRHTGLCQRHYHSYSISACRGLRCLLSAIPMVFLTTPCIYRSMQEGHASVCAVCPQHTGCTPADATTDSCDSQSHGYVERRHLCKRVTPRSHISLY